MVHHFLYKTTNLITGTIYIGVHSTKNLDDGYLGSGKILLLAIKKHGKDNFSREVLYTFGNPEDMYTKEAEIVNREFILKEDNYNLVVGGYGGAYGSLHTFETKRKISDAGLGREPYNKGKTKESNPEYNFGGPAKGTKFASEHKEKLRLAKLGTTLSELHRDKIGAGNKGKALSEETKKKMSEAKKKVPKVKCKYCDMESNLGIINRWHNNNCKNK